ncbi:MAG: nucleotidyltransferase family protein [Youngiibacter sp.]|nr:nucleotidyltransferase family protein [Youngiibacter sp.]
MSGFIEAVKTRRYTHTRISRILMQFLLSFDRCDLDTLRRGIPGAVKILESTPRGNEFLASIRKDTEIRLIHNFGREIDEYHALDSKASKVYGLLCRDYDASWDFKGYI